jgi:hypothetical protein
LVFWRLSISLNDDPDKLRCLPPLTDDILEKIILLQAKAVPDFWEKFADSPDPGKAFREAIESELTAFAHHLLPLEIPIELQSRRYGVQSYIPEEVGQALFEGEREHLLHLLIEKEIFGENYDDDGPWQGDAEDLKQTLCADGSGVRESAKRLLNSYPTACGHYLARLAAKFPSRYRKHRTSAKRGWIIYPPPR